jgi:hypothetical protein
MHEIVVDGCRACEPVSRLINELLEKGFVIVEQRMEDYHFHQLYLKLRGNTNLVDSYLVDGFSRIEQKFICNCHWSTIEIEDNSADAFLC